jgi:hypothetical protein
LWGNARLVEDNMRLVELPVGDIAYFALRLVLSGLVIVAAIVCLLFSWQARREHWPWRLATAAGMLLSAGCALRPGMQ